MIQTPPCHHFCLRFFASMLAILLLFPAALTAPANAQGSTSLGSASPGMRFGLNADCPTYTDMAYTDCFLEAWWGGAVSSLTANGYPTQMGTDQWGDLYDQIWFCVDGDKNGSNLIYNFYGEGVFTASRIDGAFQVGNAPVAGSLSVLPPNYPGNPSNVAINVPPNTPANPNAVPPKPANPFPIPLVIPANSPANPLNVVVTTCQFQFNIPTQPTAGYYLSQSMPLTWLTITNVNPTNIPGENMNNFHLIRPGYSAWQSGNSFFPVTDTSFPIFTTEFLNIYAPFCAIRFMDWMGTNSNTQLTWGTNGIVSTGTYSWAQRPPCSAGQYFGCGGCNATGNPGGAAYEFMIALCNATGCDMWMNVPLQATDDWKVGFANLIVNDPVYKLNPWLHVYYEHGNELWNWGFIAWQIVEVWAQSDMASYEPTEGPWFCHGMEMGKLIMSDVNIMQPIFGAMGRPILAGQVVNSLSYCGGGLYYIQNAYGPPQNYLYGIAGAPYFDTTISDITGSLQQAVASNVQLANQYPGLKMTAYETGQGLASTPEDTFNLDEALQSSPQMTQAYYAFGNMWQSTGGDLCMFFSTTGVDSQFGYWGHVPLTSLMDNLADPAMTKYNAIAAFNNYFGCNCGNAAPPPAPPPPPPPSQAAAPAPPPPPAPASSTAATSSSQSTAIPATGHWVHSDKWGRYYEYGSKDDPMAPKH